MSELADLFRAVADGAPPAADDDVTVVEPPDERSAGVLAFTGHNVISAAVTEEWVRSALPAGRPDVPLSPPFLAVLAALTGRVADNVDVVLVAPANGKRRGAELAEVPAEELPGLSRARYALTRRTDVHGYRCEGGLLVLGRGVAGRWEASVEVDPVVRGFGLGRGLFAAALGLLPAGEPVWVQIAPANAASLRSATAAGFRPVGAEALLLPVSGAAGAGWDGEDEPVDWFGAHTPPGPLPDPDEVYPDPMASPESPYETVTDAPMVDTELSISPESIEDTPDRADYT